MLERARQVLFLQQSGRHICQAENALQQTHVARYMEILKDLKKLEVRRPAKVEKFFRKLLSAEHILHIHQ